MMGLFFTIKMNVKKYEYNLVSENTLARWFTADGAPCNPGDAEIVLLPDQTAWEDFRWLANYEGCSYPEAEGNWIWNYGGFIPLSTHIKKLKDEIQRLEDLTSF